MGGGRATSPSTPMRSCGRRSASRPTRVQGAPYVRFFFDDLPASSSARCFFEKTRAILCNNDRLQGERRSRRRARRDRSSATRHRCQCPGGLDGPPTSPCEAGSAADRARSLLVARLSPVHGPALEARSSLLRHGFRCPAGGRHGAGWPIPVLAEHGPVTRPTSRPLHHRNDVGNSCRAGAPRFN